MKIGDKFIDLDKRQIQFYGKERIVTIVELRDGIAIVDSTTNKPGRSSAINLQRLSNKRLFKACEDGEQ